MKPLHHKKHTLAKRFLSLLCVLALCLGLLPATALAAEEDAPGTLYVGQTQITGSGYWTTDANGKLAAGNADNYNVYYDGNGTLTLNDATIQGRGNSSNAEPQDYGIYASSTTSQSVSLTIKLIGNNTVKGYSGIYVGASDGDSTLVIQSDTNGSLEANGSGWNGITISSDSGNASLTINNASVVANSEKLGSHGVSIKSSSSTELSLTVNGGSLTATGTYGIFYSSLSGTNPSTFLTVSDSALIKALPSIYASVASVPTPKADNESGGIVFDGTEGTVYGNVTLQDDLTIDQGETLTIGKDASLTVPENVKLTNNGEIDNSGELNGTVGGSGTVTPKITTDSLPDGTVNQLYTATLQATGNDITWSASDLPDGLTLNESTGTISGTPTKEGTFNFTVTATNSAGNASKEYTLNIKPAKVSVTGVKLDQTELDLVVGGTEILIATVEPNTATDKTVTWESSNPDVATVDQNGNVKAVASGTATITVKTVDGSHTDTCAVTVTQPVTGVTLDKGTLSLFTGESETLNATVAPGDATNKNVTWSSDKPEVATVDANGKITAKGEGEATITVRTADGSYTATCTVKVTDPVYDMTTDPAALDFGSAYTGYAQPAAQTVTVKNTGNQPVTLTQPSSTDNFEVGALSTTTLATGETASFTIQPKDKLPRGSYSEQITISGNDGASATLTASFTVKEPPYTGKYSYEISTDIGDNGALTVDRYATEGEKVTIDVTPDQAYKLDELVVTANGKDVELTANSDGTYTFTMPSADVRISASFAEDPDWTPDEPEEPTTDVSDLFIDIAPDAWYKDAVQYAYDNGLMTGVSATEFAPEQTTTRAMIVSILARLENVTTAEAAGFADVDDEWYATAVNWAANVGVVNGYEDNTFKPNTAITREQLAAILMNYAAYKGEDVSNRADLTSYTDQPSTWAEEAISWSVAEGLLTGVTADTLQPQGAATRAQVAAILQRFLSE